MNQRQILESHQQFLKELFADVMGEKYKGQSISREVLKALTGKLTANANLNQQIHSFYNEKLKEEGPGFSFLRAVRTYIKRAVLPEKRFNYYSAIEVVMAMFEKKFKNYSYLEAVKNFIEDRKTDDVNASAEWRTYFEHRFNMPIRNHLEKFLKDHKLTLNFSLWSFLMQGTLPVYRMHVNLTNPEDQEQEIVYQEREKAFGVLKTIQTGYSYVWELVGNNIRSILHFHKIPGESLKMSIYEIDPDAGKTTGRGRARYYGKCEIECTSRNYSLLSEKAPGADVIANKIEGEEGKIPKLFQDHRRKNLEEKEYQYSVMRFLIRSGIFDPSHAVVQVQGNVPMFGNLLTGAGKKINEKKKEKNLSGFEKRLLSEIKGIDLADLTEIRNKQYTSSFKRWENAKQENPMQVVPISHHEKFSKEENIELDKVIAYIDLINPEIIDKRIATFEAGFFHVAHEDNKINDIYWFPVIINWKRRYSGGSVFLNSDKPIGLNKPEEISAASTPPVELFSHMTYLSGLFVNNLIEEIEDSVQPGQERAAAVSIMSRNISHNLGSHVFSYLKNLLSDEHQMLKKGVLENLLEEKNGRWAINPDILEKNEFQEDAFVAPFLRSAGRLLGYLQERQDFIGVLASDWYLYYGTGHFREQILDYFFGKQIVKSPNELNIFETRNLILDYIAFSEGYKPDDIKFEAKWIDAETGEEQDILTKKEWKDVEIALPAGNTGRQAIFTIIENLLRNTAKHGLPKEKRDGKCIRITLSLQEVSGNNDYYLLELTDNGGNTTSEVIERIQKSITRNLIDKEGKPDERHKGIKEVQIAAAWLRGLGPDQLKKQIHDQLPILKVSEIDNNLRYSFYLQKPKPGLLIVKDKPPYITENNKWGSAYAALKDWDIVQHSQGVNTNPGRKPYRFVLTHEYVSEKTSLDRIREDNPVRVVAGIKDVELKHPLFQEALYRKWINSGFSKFDLAITGSNHTPSPADTPILIEDARGREIKKNEPVIAFSAAKAQELPGFILFREHNEAKPVFEDFKKRNSSIYPGKVRYLEGVTANNSTNRLLRQEKFSEYWALKMREVALTKILIVDERIWNSLRSGKEVAFNEEILKNKHIHILSLEQRKGKLYFVNLLDKKIARIKNNGSIKWRKGYSKEDYHFVSLHQGLLDRVLNYCEPNLKEFPEVKSKSNYLFEKFREEFPARLRYLIHSGRSKTPVLPNGVAFVQLSSLDTALNDCKYTLCELFYASIIEE